MRNCTFIYVSESRTLSHPCLYGGGISDRIGPVMVFVKRSNQNTSASCVKVQVDLHNLLIELQLAFMQFAFRLRGSCMCVWELSQLPMVGACSHRVPLIPCYSGNTRITAPPYTGLSPSLATLSNVLIFGLDLHIVSRTPHQQAGWFGLFRFRSPLLTESHSLSFPLLTEMFHFSRYRSFNLTALAMNSPGCDWV